MRLAGLLLTGALLCQTLVLGRCVNCASTDCSAHQATVGTGGSCCAEEEGPTPAPAIEPAQEPACSHCPAHKAATAPEPAAPPVEASASEADPVVCLCRSESYPLPLLGVALDDQFASHPLQEVAEPFPQYPILSSWLAASANGPPPTDHPPRTTVLIL